MMQYRIKPEFFSAWGEDADENTVMTRDEVEMIARGWEKSVEDILPQLIVEDDNGTNWEAITYLMDDEIREDLHIRITPCSEDEFLEEYKKRHLEKFGEEFTY